MLPASRTARKAACHVIIQISCICAYIPSACASVFAPLISGTLKWIFSDATHMSQSDNRDVIGGR